MLPLIHQNLTLIFGKFGAGKSFYTVIEAYKAYKRGEIVVSNMWLAFPHIRWYVPEELPPIITEVQRHHDEVATPFYAPNSYKISHNIHDTSKDKSKKPKKFFFLIDEAGLFFNARNFKKNFDNPKMLEFFVQPRKYDCSIAIICQDLNMIDVNFRRLAQDVVEFRKWIFGLFRLGESYDTKYLMTEQQGWNPDTPVLRRKFYLHPFYTIKSNIRFFGGLYYTKEILGDRAVRSNEHIRTLENYLQQEKENPDFHKWDKNFKIVKQELFGISEREEIEDNEKAIEK